MVRDGRGNDRRVSCGSRQALRDLDNPGRFVSFGPWESLEVVEEWRAYPPFKEGVERIRDLIDGFEPGTYEVSAEVSASSSR